MEANKVLVTTLKSFDFNSNTTTLNLSYETGITGDLSQNLEYELWIKPKKNPFSETNTTPDRGLLWRKLDDAQINIDSSTGLLTIQKTAFPPNILISQHEFYVTILQPEVALDVPTQVQLKEKTRTKPFDLATEVQRKRERDADYSVPVIVTDRTGIYILRNKVDIDSAKNPTLDTEYELKKIIKISTDEFGQPLKLFGARRADQTAFSYNYHYFFVAGKDGDIYVVDLLMQKVVHTIHLPNGASNPISSLAVADSWLYVAQKGANGKLQRISLGSKGWLTQIQSINIPTSQYGYYDLAINSERYLAITAPTQHVFISNGIQPTSNKGNVYIVDLEHINYQTMVLEQGYHTLTLNNLPNSYMGKGPQFISAGIGEGEFVLTNGLDQSHGFLSIALDFNGRGDIVGSPTLKTTPLKPLATNPNPNSTKHKQVIERPVGLVTTWVDGEEYALVSDYNTGIIKSSGLQNDEFINSLLTPIQQRGGKIAIIQDPFGIPKYLGATTPINGGGIEQIAVSVDYAGNKTLYASIIEDKAYEQNNITYTKFAGSLLIWDATKLIRAAKAKSLLNVSNTIPIDLKKVANVGFVLEKQLQPEKIEKVGTDIFEWISSIAVPQTMIRLSDGYGDPFDGNVVFGGKGQYEPDQYGAEHPVTIFDLASNLDPAYISE